MQALSAAALFLIYNLFLTSLGYSATFISQVLFIGALGGALGILPAGPLGDRIGWRDMLLWSNLLGGAALLIQFLFPTGPVILVTAFVVGLSVAMTLVVNSPLLTENSTPTERTALFGLNNATSFLASVAGTLLGGFLPDWLGQAAVRDSFLLRLARPVLAADPTARGYQVALVLVGALAIPSLIPIVMMARRTAIASAPAEPAPVVQPPTDASPNAQPGVRLAWSRLAPLLAQGRRVALGPIGRFSTSQALLGFGAGLFYPFFNLYFVDHLRTTTSFFGVLSSAQTLLLAGAALLAAPLASRFGKLRSSVVTQALSLPFLFALGAIPLVSVAATAFLLRSVLMNIASPALQVYYMEGTPEGERGLASSVYNATWQGAGALGALAGGAIISGLGYAWTFYLALPLYALSIALLALWFTPRRLAQPIERPQSAMESASG